MRLSIEQTAWALVLSPVYFFVAVVTDGIPVAVGMADNWDEEKKPTAVKPSAFAKPEIYTEPVVGAFVEDGAIVEVYGAVDFMAAFYYTWVVAAYLRGCSIFPYPLTLI